MKHRDGKKHANVDALLWIPCSVNDCECYETMKLGVNEETSSSNESGYGKDSAFPRVRELFVTHMLLLV